VRSAIVLVTTASVIMLDSGWWLAAAVVAGIVLFAAYHHAEYRTRPTAKAGTRHLGSWTGLEGGGRSPAIGRGARVQ